MPKNEERMPATGAGLIRYFQEEGNGVKVSPKSVIIFTAAVVVLVFVLHIAGRSVFGF